MNWLRIGLVGLMLALLALYLAALRSHFIEQGQAQVQTRWDAQKLVDQAETQRLAQAARADELTKFRNAERNAHEDAQRELARARRTADLAASHSRLRATLEALTGRELPATPSDPGAAACAVQATTYRELFASCADRYAAVATAAEQLRDQVTGLQDYALQVCRSPQGASSLSTTGNAP